MDSKLYPRHLGWVMTANFGEGLPYAIVNTLMVALLADMGMSNGAVAAITGALILPWSLKFLWSPLVDSISTKRRWMLVTEFALAVVFLATAVALSSSLWQYLLVCFAVCAAFFSATYDISCDGFYMKVLDDNQQAFFVGIRSMAYRLGLLLATGGLVWLAGRFESSGLSSTLSWQITFGIIAAIFFLLWVLYHFILPKEDSDIDIVPVGHVREKDVDSRQTKKVNVKVVLKGYADSIRNFFTKQSWQDLIFLLLFILTYRLGEAFLSKVTILFLKDTVENGGIGLNNEQYGFLYGTLGVLALTVGGILGGIFISRFSLRKSIIPMALALNIPDLLYVYLAMAQPSSLGVVGTCVAVEQFGYGFGLTAFTVYLLQCAKGEFATAHYAFLTALMNIGMAIPTTISGFWQENIGYTEFFIRTCWLTLPGIAMSVWYIFRNKSEENRQKMG